MSGPGSGSGVSCSDLLELPIGPGHVAFIRDGERPRTQG
uniref:Uncharacterized protein n=1 Tax=Arundo donax TaxID=35708 RepID=A0A0A8Z893_ARUDO